MVWSKGREGAQQQRMSAEGDARRPSSTVVRAQALTAPPLTSCVTPENLITTLSHSVLTGK